MNYFQATEMAKVGGTETWRDWPIYSSQTDLTHAFFLIFDHLSREEGLGAVFGGMHKNQALYTMPEERSDEFEKVAEKAMFFAQVYLLSKCGYREIPTAGLPETAIFDYGLEI